MAELVYLNGLLAKNRHYTSNARWLVYEMSF